MSQNVVVRRPFSPRSIGLPAVLVAAASIPALWVKTASDIPVLLGAPMSKIPMVRMAEGTDYHQYVDSELFLLFAITALIFLAALGWMSVLWQRWVGKHKGSAVASAALAAFLLLGVTFNLIMIPLVPMAVIGALSLPDAIRWARTPSTKQLSE
jgi:hypothetical protein